MFLSNKNHNNRGMLFLVLPSGSRSIFFYNSDPPALEDH